jgi:hypothetical protein
VNCSQLGLIELGLIAVDQMPIHNARSCIFSEGPEGPTARCYVASFESDYDEVQERWHRDPFGRDNNQSVTKAVENQKNLEEALSNQGFSRGRAAKIAFYMTRCEGQFQEWDLIMKKQGRVSNPGLREESMVGLATESVQGRLGRAVGDDGDQDESGDEDSDRDTNEASSMVGRGGARLLQDSPGVGVGPGGIRPAKRIRKSRTKKDERQRRREQKAKIQRIKEYASYTREDYVRAARRYDMVYGSAENLYQLAEDGKASRLIQAQRVRNQPTTVMMINGHLVDVEDATLGLTRPRAEEALTAKERKARDLEHKQLWADKQRDALIQRFQSKDTILGPSMSR